MSEQARVFFCISCLLTLSQKEDERAGADLQFQSNNVPLHLYTIYILQWPIKMSLILSNLMK